MKKLLILAWILCLTSLNTYSQKIVLIEQDTNVCFNTNQSKYLLKTYYRLQECQELNKLQQNEISSLAFIITLKDQSYNNAMEMYANCDSAQTLTYNQLKKTQDIVKTQQKKLKRNEKVMLAQLGVLITETLMLIFALR